MITIQLKLGRAIQRLREQADYSQEALAAAAGIHRTYMGRIEQGRSAPTITTVKKIADALRITPSQLLAEAERER